MSALESNSYTLRAGIVDCACTLPDSDDAAGRSDQWRLSASFACAIIAQALLLTSLPIVGRVIAPSEALANLPYALTWLGAALASLPASMLVDQFGRRAAFALGASTGIAGALLGAWAAANLNFAALCIGAVWLGIAQGFALFYRHAGAAQQGRARTILIVMAGGSVAAFVVPGLVAFAWQAYGPVAYGTFLIFAGLANLAALPLILTLPHSATAKPSRAGKIAVPYFWIATALSASAWCVMAHVMGGAPRALVDCGVGATLMSGMIAWHFLAMYGPLAIGTRIINVAGTGAVTAIAVGSLIAILLYGPSNAPLVEARLVSAGIAWSLAQIASASLLEKAGTLTRGNLALHDALALFSVLAGLLWT